MKAIEARPSKSDEVPIRPAAIGIGKAAGVVLASFVFASLLSIIAFFDAWASMVRVWWNSETFAHGFIALPCAAWMLWRRREDWHSLAQKTWWPATLALAGCGLVWLVGRLGGVSSIEQFGAVAVIPATMLLLVGPTVTRAIAFPLAFLFFAVPVGQFLTPVMMDYTADATVAAVRWSGVPVFREGLHFTLPTGRWSVVEACSGLRYLIASLALGVLYAYLQFRTLRYRLAFVALAIVVPIIANWIRAYGIVMLGHLSNMKLAAGADHLIYGWLFFGVVMALLFWIGSLWNEPVRSERPTSDPDDANRAMDESGRKDTSRPSRARIGFAVAAMFVVLMWRPVSAILLDQSRSADGIGPLHVALDALPPAPALDYAPRFAGASGTLRTSRYVNGVPVDVHAFHYVRQHETGEMVHGGNHVANAKDLHFQVVSTRRLHLPWGTVGAYRIRRHAGGSVLVWQWYAVGGTQTASKYRAKAATAWSLITGRGDQSLVLVLATPIETGAGPMPSEQIQDAARRLQSIAGSLQPAIHDVVRQAVPAAPPIAEAGRRHHSPPAAMLGPTSPVAPTQ